MITGGENQQRLGSGRRRCRLQSITPATSLYWVENYLGQDRLIGLYELQPSTIAQTVRDALQRRRAA